MAYLQIPEEVWEDDSLTLEERALIGIVWGWQGRCEYSYSMIASKLGCCRAKAITLVNGLIASGKLAKTSRHLQTNNLVCTKNYSLLVSTVDHPSLPSRPPQSTEWTPPVYGVDHPSLQNRPNITNNNTIYDPSNERVGAVAPTTPSPSPAPTKKPRSQKPGINWDEIEATPEQLEALKEWESYRRSKRDPISQQSIPKILKKYGTSLQEAVDFTIEKGWKGLRHPSEQNGELRKTTPAQEATHCLNALKKALELPDKDSRSEALKSLLAEFPKAKATLDSMPGGTKANLKKLQDLDISSKDGVDYRITFQQQYSFLANKGAR